MSFQVDDGLIESNVLTRQITVTPVAVWNGNASGNLSDATNWVDGSGAESVGRQPGPGWFDRLGAVQRFSGDHSFYNLIFDGSCTLSGNPVLLDSMIVECPGRQQLVVAACARRRRRYSGFGGLPGGRGHDQQPRPPADREHGGRHEGHARRGDRRGGRPDRERVGYARSDGPK